MMNLEITFRNNKMGRRERKREEERERVSSAKFASTEFLASVVPSGALGYSVWGSLFRRVSRVSVGKLE